MELSLGSRFECSAPMHIFVAISLQVMASPKDEDREMERIQVGKFLFMDQFQLLDLPSPILRRAIGYDRSATNWRQQNLRSQRRFAKKTIQKFIRIFQKNTCPIFSTSNWPDLQRLYFSISFSIIFVNYHKFLPPTRYELCFCFFTQSQLQL